MEFENSLKEFKFVDIDKNLYSQVGIFGANLKEYGVSEVEIYLSETFDLRSAQDRFCLQSLFLVVINLISMVKISRIF